MLKILGLLAVLLAPLPSFAEFEGKKVKGLCFCKIWEAKRKTKKFSNNAKGKVFPVATKSDLKATTILIKTSKDIAFMLYLQLS